MQKSIYCYPLLLPGFGMLWAASRESFQDVALNKELDKKHAKDSEVLCLLKVRKQVFSIASEWNHRERWNSGYEVSSNKLLYPPLLMSDLGSPVKNLLDPTTEKLKISFSDWYQVQGLGSVLEL